MKLLQGDCREVLKTLPDNSVDSIVTDPPYELGFMGKKWDASGIAYDVGMWAEAMRVLKPGGHLLAFSGSRTYHRMTCAIEDAGFEVRDQIMWVYGSGFPKSHNLKGEWQGWGTALKPAHEPICVARKQLIGTVAKNVQTHGTGAMNIDGCRVGERFPANFIHEGLSEEWSRFFYCAKASKNDREEGLDGFEPKSTVSNMCSGSVQKIGEGTRLDGKPLPKRANIHPTVKPTDLMRYLCRLVTPPKGTVLDPFMGSGSTGKAAALEGFDFIGIDMTPEYIEIAKARIAHGNDNAPKDLFDVA